MNFLSPAVIAIAAGLTIPPLVALYFLKLKRIKRTVPSTLLWKRAVEDLRVNAPFQRLRANLLLLLQLIILILGAVALGEPMLHTVQRAEDTVILLVDHSASMNVLEEGGRTRLDLAKEQALRCIDGMADGARAMVIAFSDQAATVSSFDTDKDALKRKIETIEPTESTTTLGEAMSLAEAYTQNIIIGQEEGATDVAPESAAPDATVYLFTDGRIRDAQAVSLQRFEAANVRVTTVGQRSDNVGILSMDARRNYERPERLQVAAAVQNFGPQPATFKAVLQIEGEIVAVQDVHLGAATAPASEGTSGGQPAVDSVGVVAFDEVQYEGAGIAEVLLSVDDALVADDRAWTVIDPPRNVRLLLVTEGNFFLERALDPLPLTYVKMTPSQYENAAESELMDGERSAYDVVMFDRHSTARLPQGNYLFWGAAPQIEGVASGRMINDEILFNWDETHPVLRYVSVPSISVYEWVELTLPPNATSIIDGQSSPVLAHLVRDASQYLICAFSLITEDERGTPVANTNWFTQVDFVIFMQNAVQFLASNVAMASRKSLQPGEPATLPVPAGTAEVRVHRPDQQVDEVSTARAPTVHYARTRNVGVYTVEPGVDGNDRFAVNLFSPTESNVAPAQEIAIGTEQVTAQAGDLEVNQPAWTYFLLALLAVLLLEWIVYNRRVFI